MKFDGLQSGRRLTALLQSKDEETTLFWKGKYENNNPVKSTVRKDWCSS